VGLKVVSVGFMSYLHDAIMIHMMPHDVNGLV
jgi:hypothetical protein